MVKRLEGRACVCGCSDEQEYSAGSSDHGGDEAGSCQRCSVLWLPIGTALVSNIQIGQPTKIEKDGTYDTVPTFRLSPSRVIIGGKAKTMMWLFQLQKVDDDCTSDYESSPCSFVNGYHCDSVSVSCLYR
jgi:hypothetical protein